MSVKSREDHRLPEGIREGHSRAKVHKQRSSVYLDADSYMSLMIYMQRRKEANLVNRNYFRYLDIGMSQVPAQLQVKLRTKTVPSPNGEEGN